MAMLLPIYSVSCMRAVAITQAILLANLTALSRRQLQQTTIDGRRMYGGSGVAVCGWWGVRGRWGADIYWGVNVSIYRCSQLEASRGEIALIIWYKVYYGKGS